MTQNMSGKKWTKDELKFLVSNYPDNKTEDVARALNRSTLAVYNAAYLLKLSKSSEYLQSENSGRLTKLSESGKTYRYAKGHTPFNKGKKMDADTYYKVKTTMFKPGHIPPNNKHDGAISLRNDSGRLYYYIRISKAKWMPLQKYNWEKVHGAVNKNVFLRCKDGNTLNCDISNWELISRSKNMKLNSVHNYPKEIAAAVQLRGALNRQINKHTKKIKQ